MKIATFFIAALPALGADFETFTDNALNATQRNTACQALRGNKQTDVIAAMRSALDNPKLQACAGANLRIAGAVDELLSGLTEKDPAARAVAARELGAMQKPEFLVPLRKAAEDRDLLVASNAVEGLARYADHSSAPQLREVAQLGGVLTSMAVDTLVDWHDAEVLPIARQLVTHKEPGDQLIGVRVIGIAGDPTDLPKLRDLVKDDAALSAGSRGFGLMPAISISRAARTAIQHIEARASLHP
ncbi:MAG: HEAT repeat domain-containing protein [Acidobacteriota bacterium]